MAWLRKLWEGWKAFGRWMGNMVARVVLTVFYFTVFVPFGLGVRWFSDPLQVRTVPGELWRPHEITDRAMADVRRQY